MYKNEANVALVRHRIPEEDTRRNIERGENFAFLWNGFLILLLGFFIPTPVYIGLLVAYVIAGALLNTYRNEVRAKLFRFFDRVADFFGFIQPVQEPINEPPSPTPSEPTLDRSFIQRRLRRTSEPAISDTKRDQLYAEVKRTEHLYVESITRRRTLQYQQFEESWIQSLQLVQQQENAMGQNPLEEKDSLVQNTLNYKNIQRLAYLTM